MFTVVLNSQPRAISLFLRFGLIGQRLDAVRSFSAAAEFDQQRAHLVETKDRQIDQIAGLFLVETAVEEVSRSSRVIECDDLIAGV